MDEASEDEDSSRRGFFLEGRFFFLSERLSSEDEESRLGVSDDVLKDEALEDEERDLCRFFEERRLEGLASSLGCWGGGPSLSPCALPCGGSLLSPCDMMCLATW